MKVLDLTPYAKVNLGLHIVARRADGYHELRTVFVPVEGYHDRLRIEFEGSGDSALQLLVEGYDCRETIEENLVWRAYHALMEYAPLPARVQLWKRIPMGGGLGGGSSDAASALQAFAQHCRSRVPESELAQVAASLGSDVPFFLKRGIYYAEGRGEELMPLDLSLHGVHIVIVTPPIHVSTKEAFSAVRPRGDRECLKDLLREPMEHWQGRVVNDFWETQSLRFDQLVGIAQSLRELGADYVSLSGSGPSIYGLFRRKVEVAGGRFTDCKVYVGEL